MSKKKEKGDKYEAFTKEVLLLKQLTWSYDESNENISFDVVSNENIIYGISGAHHQIDVHLTSSVNPSVHLLCECKAHNPAVEKTHACSFVTVINDIKERHNDWKIIPVFAADDGYQSGAFTILKYYKIIPIEMKDYREAKRVMTLSMKSISPIFKTLNATLEDGTIVSDKSCFRNDSRGSYLGISNAINSFELLDENNNEIKDLVYFVGKFYTGKRKVRYDEYDEFIEQNSMKKLISIKGEITGNTEESLGTHKDIFESKVITSMSVGDGYYYKINKNGTCEKFVNEEDSKRIFK